MIIIETLEFSNIMSYGEDNRIDFTKAAVTQIIGKNGCGKSSIATILEECLYNKNSRGIPKGELSFRHSDKPGYSIKTTFSKDVDRYVVDKKVTSTAKVKLFKNGTDISGHTATQTYKLIESIIGTDFNTFTKLINQSMASSLDFLSATDSNRKKFLIDLIGLDQYAQAETKVKTVVKEVSNKLSEVKGSKAYVEKSLESARLAASIPTVPVKDPIDNSDAIAELMADIRVLQRNKQDIDKLNNDIGAKNSLVRELNSLRVCHEPVDTTRKDIDLVNKNLQGNSIKAVQLSQELTKLKNVTTECYTCKRPFDDVPDMSEQISKISEEISKLAEEKQELNELLYHAKQHNAEIDQWNAYEQKKSNLLSKLDGQVEEVALQNSESLDNEINIKNTQIQALKSEADKRTQDIKSANETNMRITFSKDKVAELEANLAEYEYETDALITEQSDWDVLKHTFSNKGLVAYKIESSIKVFEKLINEYLAELSKGQFALSFTVTDSKLEVVVYDGDYRIHIKSASSGELNKINTATLLAVRKLMSAISKVNINLLFIDEVSSVLDGEGRDDLTELLLKERHLNSLVVTHEYTHPLTDKMFITKNNKVSSISNGD